MENGELAASNDLAILLARRAGPTRRCRCCSAAPTAATRRPRPTWSSSCGSRATCARRWSWPSATSTSAGPTRWSRWPTCAPSTAAWTRPRRCTGGPSLCARCGPRRVRRRSCSTVRGDAAAAERELRDAAARREPGSAVRVRAVPRRRRPARRGAPLPRHGGGGGRRRGRPVAGGDRRRGPRRRVVTGPGNDHPTAAAPRRRPWLGRVLHIRDRGLRAQPAADCVVGTARVRPVRGPTSALPDGRLDHEPHRPGFAGHGLGWRVVAPDPSVPPGFPRAPMRYGAGLAVLVVGTGDAPFPATRSAVAALPGGGADCVVLVDSGTPGGVPAADRDDAEQATVLRIGEDVGRGAAVNRAVAELPADVGLVAVAPPRLRWADGALTELRAAAVRQPRAGILAPRVRAEGRPVPSTHPLPRRARGVVAVLGGRPWPPDGGPDPIVEEPVGWSSAPGLLLRRAALDSVDGFDPRYPARLDDLDLADRLARAGWLHRARADGHGRAPRLCAPRLCAPRVWGTAGHRRPPPLPRRPLPPTGPRPAARPVLRRTRACLMDLCRASGDPGGCSARRRSRRYRAYRRRRQRSGAPPGRRAAS